MTTTAEAGLEQWNGKRVVVVRKLAEADNDGNTAVEVRGLVQVGNQMGILIKPKGKVTFDLIPAEEIDEIYAEPEESKDLKASKLKPVAVDKVKRHLLDRHGYTLEWVNSVTDEQAAEHHDAIDHEASKLGHVHVEEKAEEAAAEGEPAGDEA